MEEITNRPVKNSPKKKTKNYNEKIIKSPLIRYPYSIHSNFSRNTKIKYGTINLLKKIKSTVLAKDLHKKNKLVTSSRIFLSTIIIISGLFIFEIYDPYQRDNKFKFNEIILLLFHTFLSILSVILYLISLYMEGLYLKTLRRISENVNIFFYYGWENITLYSLFLFIHPFYLNKSLSDDSFSEIYYDSEHFNIVFQRNINDLMLISQITIHYFSILMLLFKMTKWESPLFKILCKSNRVRRNLYLNIKIFLNEYPELFSILLFLFLLIYFSLVIRVAEMGYLREMKISDFYNYDNYIDYVKTHQTFKHYYNCFWNIFITMSEIGYGDIVVNTLLGRFIIFFIALSAIIIFYIFDVDHFRFFKMTLKEDQAFEFFNSLEKSELIKKSAAMTITSFFKLKLLEKKLKTKKNFKKTQIKKISFVDLIKKKQKQFFINFSNKKRNIYRKFRITRIANKLLRKDKNHLNHIKKLRKNLDLFEKHILEYERYFGPYHIDYIHFFLNLINYCVDEIIILSISKNEEMRRTAEGFGKLTKKRFRRCFLELKRSLGKKGINFKLNK